MISVFTMLIIFISFDVSRGQSLTLPKDNIDFESISLDILDNVTRTATSLKSQVLDITDAINKWFYTKVSSSVFIKTCGNRWVMNKEKKHCYLFVNQSMSYDESQKNCKENDGTLAKMMSVTQEEQTFVATFLENNTPYWIAEEDIICVSNGSALYMMSTDEQGSAVYSEMIDGPTDQISDVCNNFNLDLEQDNFYSICKSNISYFYRP